MKMGIPDEAEPWIRDPRPPEQITAEFWAEQRALRERREEIASMPSKIERIEAVMKDAWPTSHLLTVLIRCPDGLRLHPFDDALDQWLVEDRVPEVAVLWERIR
jgi:hypothetical protein